MRNLFYVLPLATLLFAGCSGGSGLSGPDPNTRKGLGTLIVRVETAAGGRVTDGAAIVRLEKSIQVVRNGRVTFNNIVPGRYFVQADSQGISLPGEGRNVDIEADKTRQITLQVIRYIRAQTDVLAVSQLATKDTKNSPRDTKQKYK